MEGRERNLQGKEHTRWESLASRRRRRRKISCVLECQRGMPGHVLSIYIPHCIVCVCMLSADAILLLIPVNLYLDVRESWRGPAPFKNFCSSSLKDPTCSWFITNSSWKEEEIPFTWLDWPAAVFQRDFPLHLAHNLQLKKSEMKMLLS